MADWQPKLDLDQIDFIFTQIERGDGRSAYRMPTSQACVIPDYDSELYRQHMRMQPSFPGHRGSAASYGDNFRRKAALTGPNIGDSEFKLSFPKDDLLRKEESAKADLRPSFPSDSICAPHGKDATRRLPQSKSAAVGSLQFTSKLLLDQNKVAPVKSAGVEKAGMATPRGLENVSFVIPYIVDEGSFYRFKTETLAQSTTGAKARVPQEIPDYGYEKRKKNHSPEEVLAPSMPMLLYEAGSPEKYPTTKARTKHPADKETAVHLSALTQQCVETVVLPAKILEMRYPPPETKQCKGYHCWRRYVEASTACRATGDSASRKDQQQASRSEQLPAKKPVRQPATERPKKQPLPFTIIQQTPEQVVSQPSYPAYHCNTNSQQQKQAMQEPVPPKGLPSMPAAAFNASSPGPRPDDMLYQGRTPYNQIAVTSSPYMTQENRYEGDSASNINSTPGERFQDSINLMPKAEQAQFLMGLIAPYEAQILYFQQQELFSDSMAQQAILAADDDMARQHLLVREQARAYREQLQRKLDNLDARLHELFKEDLEALKRSMAARK